MERIPFKKQCFFMFFTFSDSPTDSIHGTGIFPSIYHKIQPNSWIGKYTLRPMDPMGLWVI